MSFMTFYLYYILRYGYAPAKIYRLAIQAFKSQYDRGDDPLNG